MSTFVISARLRASTMLMMHNFFTSQGIKPKTTSELVRLTTELARDVALAANISDESDEDYAFSQLQENGYVGNEGRSRRQLVKNISKQDTIKDAIQQAIDSRFVDNNR